MIVGTLKSYHSMVQSGNQAMKITLGLESEHLSMLLLTYGSLHGPCILSTSKESRIAPCRPWATDHWHYPLLSLFLLRLHSVSTQLGVQYIVG